MMHKTKTLLLAANAALAMGIVAAILLPALLPLSAEESAPVRSKSSCEPADAFACRRIEPLETYLPIFARPLSRPLFDPPPAAPPAAAAAPILSAKLVGTILESGHTMALFRMPDGKEKFVGLGETVDGISVRDIGPGCATILFNGQTITCQAEKPPATPAPTTNPAGAARPPYPMPGIKDVKP